MWGPLERLLRKERKSQATWFCVTAPRPSSTVWAAYQREAPLTAALVSKQHSSGAPASGPECALLVSIGRQGSHRNEIVRAFCSQLSDQPGPCPKRAITTKIPVSSVISKVTVRLIAPQSYRQFVAGVVSRDDPKAIIITSGPNSWHALLRI